MFGVNVAVYNHSAPYNIFVRLQIKDGYDNGGTFRLNTSQDDEQDIFATCNTYEVNGSNERHFKNDRGESSPLHESDRVLSLYSSRNDNIKMEDMNVTPRMNRPRSLLSFKQPLNIETKLYSDIYGGTDLFARSAQDLEAALENSESQRNSLIHKLNEAQTALELQNERFKKVESAVEDNSVLVKDLKLKEMEYQTAIGSFEASVKEKQQLQLQNLQLREDLKERVNALDCQLRTFKKLHNHGKNINKQNTFPVNMTAAFSILEEENRKLEKDNISLSKKVQEKSYEIEELRSLLQAARNEREIASSSKWIVSTEVKEFQDTITELKSQLSSTNAKHSRLFHDHLEMCRKTERLVLDKEQLTKENIEMKQALENSITKADYEKLQEGHQKLQQQYNNLNSKFQEFVVSCINDRDASEKEKQQVMKLRKERDDLVEQAALLQAQLFQAANSWKQAEEQIYKLTHELTDLNVQLKQKNSTNKEYSDKESSLRQEVVMLKQQLTEVKEKEFLQEKIFRNLKEKSLQDANSELQQLKGKLKELMGEMKQNELTIEQLELKLRSSSDLVEEKLHQIEELHKNMETMVDENLTLQNDVQMIWDLLAAESSHNQEQPTMKRSQSVKSLQEALADTQRYEKYSSYDQSAAAAFRKSLRLRPASVPPLSTEPSKSQQKVPKKSETEGGSHLQKLISKYRSHSEMEETTPQRAVKPLTGVISPKLISKSKFSAVVSTPTGSATDQIKEAAMKWPGTMELGSSARIKCARPLKSLPQRPISTPPTSTSLPSTKSSFMRNISRDIAKETTTKPSTMMLSSPVRRILPSNISGKNISGPGT